MGIDTCVFIYYFQHHPKYASFIEHLLDDISGHSKQCTVSSLVLTELFVHPYKADDLAVAKSWLDFFRFSPFMDIQDLTPPIALEAARLRTQFSLSTPDSIHLATAITSGCEVFVGNDKKLKKVDDITVICLDECIRP